MHQWLQQYARGVPVVALLAYVKERDAKLQEVMACGVSRDIAKQLIIRVMYGGTAEAWVRDKPALGDANSSLSEEYVAAVLQQLPPWLHDLERELVHVRDVLAQHPELELRPHPGAKGRGP